MKFEGIYTAIITPFKNAGHGIDEKIYRKLIERQIEAGIHGIIIAGSTGEGGVLDSDEWNDALRIGLDYKKQTQIIGSCGSSSTEQTADKFKRITDLGVDGILISTPPYNKPPQRGLIDYFQKVCAAAQTPAIIYNVPGRTSVAILPETMKEIWKIPNAISLKEASGDWAQVQKFKQDLPEGKTLLSGEDALNFDFLKIKAHGAISVLSNVVPKALVQMWNHWKANDLQKAEEIAQYTKSLAHALFVESNPIPAKWCLSQIMGVDLPPRSPLCPLEKSFEPKLRSELENMKKLSFI